jgi:hypothetical protein
MSVCQAVTPWPPPERRCQPGSASGSRRSGGQILATAPPRPRGED